MAVSTKNIEFRMMTADDVGTVPIGCQGDAADVAARISDLGSAAVLAYEGDQHVGQLQFRRYDAATRSPDGVMDPLYWGDFGDHAPDMPAKTLSIYCYHVGQVDDSDARDEQYQGHGIGTQLLDHLVSWAEGAGFDAIVAKAAPPVRQVMVFMGGQPASVYEQRGFETVASWSDQDVTDAVQRSGAIPFADRTENDSLVSCCVKKL